MKKILLASKPDLVIAIKTANVEDVMFRSLRAYIRQIPILGVCYKGEVCDEKYAG